MKGICTYRVAPARCPAGQACDLRKGGCQPGKACAKDEDCLDDDECAVNNGGCDTNPDACVNEPGGLSCECPSGYDGSGVGSSGCADVDECEDDSDSCDNSPDACVNEIGDYHCACPSGYIGDGEGEDGCSDVDECDTGADNCDNSPDACVNDAPGYHCQCPGGYTGDGIGTSGCIDIDECDVGSDNCDDSPDACINEIGGFLCECPTGFMGSGVVTNGCLPVLSGLQISPGLLTPGFSPTVTAYSSEIAIFDEDVIVTPSAESGSAITVNGETVASEQPSSPIQMDFGINTVEVVVTRQGESQTYIVDVDRVSAVFQQTYVKASDTEWGARFGGNVALYGDTLAVGAGGERSGATGINGDQDDSSALSSGAVYVFTRNGDTWS